VARAAVAARAAVVARAAAVVAVDRADPEDLVDLPTPLLAMQHRPLMGAPRR
jgi:hypothetical protein